jgi:2-(1,2-epoxy-1,2-dihydrophenyl)acetyl-CoA isomerase
VSDAEIGADGSVSLHHEDAVAWITLDRPDRLNALAGSMRDDLYDAVVTASGREGTRVIAITGAGRGFCAGADVDAMERLLAESDDRTFGQLLEAGMRVVVSIRSVPQLVVAVVNGVAAGAGASLAAACDLRVAADDARIGFTFNRIGLHPDWGATYSLPRLVGVGRAAELIFSGRMLDADEGARLGIWQKVVPASEFREQAGAWVHELAARAPLAMSAAKRSLERAFGSDLQTMLDVEAAAQLGCFRSRDVREGIAAFREKRAPSFQGK